MSFQLPSISLRKATDQLSDVQAICDKQLLNLKSIGNGAFAEVFKADYGNDIVVVKKMKDVCYKNEFIKEARLLKSLGHINIVSFKGYCPSPFALVLDYEEFNFSIFSSEKIVNNLLEFLKFISDFEDTSSFLHIANHATIEIQRGLEFLHTNDIAHRDLKPANVLVSNKHYCNTTDQRVIKYAFKEFPIRCKLTDFGESRSLLIQTNQMLMTQTNRIDRGTFPYMAPEIILAGEKNYRNVSKSLEQLKEVDVWAFGMNIFQLINPDQLFPYQDDVKNNTRNMRENIKDLLRKTTKPSPSERYAHLHSKDWEKLWKLYQICTNFKSQERPKMGSPEICISPKSNYDLGISQMTALENTDEVISQAVAAGVDVPPSHMIPPENDATNSCCFLSIYLAYLLKEQQPKTWEEVKEVSANNIKTLPFLINKYRNCHSMYDVLDAAKILKRIELLPANTMFYEMAQSNDVVSSESGKKIITDSLEKCVREDNVTCFIFTCRPYVFLLGYMNCSFFVIDTHPIPELLGGNGNGILKLFDVTRSEALTDWMECRLLKSSENAFSLLLLSEEEIGLARKNQDQEQSEVFKDIRDELKDVLSKTSDADARTLSNCFEDDSVSLETNFNESAQGQTVNDEDKQYERAQESVQNDPANEESLLNASAEKGRKCEDRSKPSIESQERVLLNDVRVKRSNAVDHEVASECTFSEHNEDIDLQVTDDETDQISAEADSVLCQQESVADESYWKLNSDIPVLCKRKTKYTPTEACEVILKQGNDLNKCKMQPLKVRENASFLIDLSKFKKWEDVKSDMNGVYSQFFRQCRWTIKLNDKNAMSVIERKKIPIINTGHYHLYLESKGNKSFSGLTRSIYFLENENGKIVNEVCLLQYTLSDSSKASSNVLPHGNSKGGRPFYPTSKSTMQSIKEKAKEKGMRPGKLFDIVTSGNDLNLRCPEERPRGKKQMANIIHKNKSKGDDIEDLLLYINHREESILLHHCDFPSDIWIFATPQMCNDVTRFCTSSVSFPMSVDPTFKMGKFEVTPVVYKHLLLKTKRSSKNPIFLGPTMIHHNKEFKTYKVLSATIASHCDGLRDCKGFVTDGEANLIDALSSDMPNAVGLRCFKHFEGNCKESLRTAGITAKEFQRPFIKKVFGEEEGILEAFDREDLRKRIDDSKEFLEEKERTTLKKTISYKPKFWTYINEHFEMMEKCMLNEARKKAGIPVSKDGVTERCYTNTSESMNNLFGWAKKNYLGNKESDLSKQEFVQHVLQYIVQNQENEIGLAISGIGEQYELTDIAKYLEVPPDQWFDLTEQEKKIYIKRFQNITLDDVLKKKRIQIETLTTDMNVPKEYKDLAIDLASFLIEFKSYSNNNAKMIQREVIRLLNQPLCIAQKVSLDPTKGNVYEVASPLRKFDRVECTVYKDHVSCKCQNYRFDFVCKHSLAVAEKVGIIIKHVDFIKKKKAEKKKSTLSEAYVNKQTAGKKGGRNKFPFRKRTTPTKDNATTDQLDASVSPYHKLHHNDNQFFIEYISENSKNCKSCDTDFCHRKKIIPFDIVFSHMERYYFPLNGDWNEKRPTRREVKRYYHPNKTCILKRFPYFIAEYISVSDGVNLTASHLEMLKEEFDYVL